MSNKILMIDKIKQRFNFIITISLLFLLSVSFSFAGWFGDTGADIMNFIVWDMIFEATRMFLFWSGIVFDNFLAMTLHSPFYNQDFVKIIWTDLRDFANIAFILSLVYIAISIMMQDIFKVRQNLIKLIIIAFLINFSFFFSRLVIDAGNVTALAFYNAIAIEPINKSTEYQLPFLDKNTLLNQKSISAGLIAATGIKDYGPGSVEIFKQAMDKKFDEDRKGILFLLGLLYSFIFFQFGKTFLIAAFGFLSRTIWLIMYIISSPLAFIAYFLPSGLDKYFWQWLNGLVRRSFCIAAYLLFMYIIYMFVKVDFLKSASPFNDSSIDLVGNLEKYLLPFIIKSLIIWTLLKKASETSISLCEDGNSAFATAFSAVAKVAVPVAGFTGGIAKKVGGAGARNLIGGTASRIIYNKDSKINQFLAKQSAKNNWLARKSGELGLLGLQKTAKDAKFGTKDSYASATKKATEKINELKSLRDKGLGKNGALKLEAHERTHNTEVTGFAKTKKGEELTQELQSLLYKDSIKTYDENGKNWESAKKLNEELIEITKNEEANSKALKDSKNNINEFSKALSEAKTAKERDAIKKDYGYLSKVDADLKLQRQRRKYDNESRVKRTGVARKASNLNVSQRTEAQITTALENIRKNQLGNNLNHVRQKNKGVDAIGGIYSVAAAAQDVIPNEFAETIRAEEKGYEESKNRQEAYSTLSKVKEEEIANIERIARNDISQLTKDHLKEIENDDTVIKKEKEIRKTENSRNDMSADVLGGRVDSKTIVRDIENTFGQKLNSIDQKMVQSDTEIISHLDNRQADKAKYEQRADSEYKKVRKYDKEIENHKTEAVRLNTELSDLKKKISGGDTSEETSRKQEQVLEQIATNTDASSNTASKRRVAAAKHKTEMSMFNKSKKELDDIEKAQQRLVTVIEKNSQASQKTSQSEIKLRKEEMAKNNREKVNTIKVNKKSLIAQKEAEVAYRQKEIQAEEVVYKNKEHARRDMGWQGDRIENEQEISQHLSANTKSE